MRKLDITFLDRYGSPDKMFGLLERDRRKVKSPDFDRYRLLVVLHRYLVNIEGGFYFTHYQYLIVGIRGTRKRYYDLYLLTVSLFHKRMTKEECREDHQTVQRKKKNFLEKV